MYLNGSGVVRMAVDWHSLAKNPNKSKAGHATRRVFIGCWRTPKSLTAKPEAAEAHEALYEKGFDWMPLAAVVPSYDAIRTLKAKQEASGKRAWSILNPS